MRVWTKVLAWTGVVLVGLGVLLFVLGPALFASVAYPLPQEYQQTVCDEAKNSKIEPKLLAGLIFVESRWNPNAKSYAGALVLTQCIRSTAIAEAARLGVTPFKPEDLITNPKMAIKFGADYLSRGIHNYGGDKKLALIAYNGGGGAVNAFKLNVPVGGTVAYANKVLSTADMYEKIYGDWCNRADLPDLSAKPQNPTDLLTTINIGDFWKGLLSSEAITTDGQNDTTDNSKSFDFGAFWQKLISN
jgi:soluble lytic murein transglycosylase